MPPLPRKRFAGLRRREREGGRTAEPIRRYPRLAVRQPNGRAGNVVQEALACLTPRRGEKHLHCISHGPTTGAPGCASHRFRPDVAERLLAALSSPGGQRRLLGVRGRPSSYVGPHRELEWEGRQSHSLVRDSAAPQGPCQAAAASHELGAGWHVIVGLFTCLEACPRGGSRFL